MKRFDYVKIQLTVSLLGVFVPLITLILLPDTLAIIPGLAANLISITTFFAGSSLTLLLAHLERVRAEAISEKSNILTLLALLIECKSIVNTSFDSLDLKGSGNMVFLQWSQRRSLVTRSLITNSGDRAYSEKILHLASKMGDFKPGIWASRQQQPELVIEMINMIEETILTIEKVRKEIMSNS